MSILVSLLWQASRAFSARVPTPLPFRPTCLSQEPDTAASPRDGEEVTGGDLKAPRMLEESGR